MALVAALGGIPATDAAAGTAGPIIRPVVTWSISDRFGIDADGDGLVDIPNTPEYTHNRAPGSCALRCDAARFDVRFEAGLTGTPADLGYLPVVAYRWEISGAGLPAPRRYLTSAPELEVALPEGDYTLEVRAAVSFGGFVVETGAVEHFVVEDLLVVAIGDSYASGEGNPEVGRQPGAAARWAGSYDPDAAAAHAAAHRSSLAWPARVALSLERSSPASSVTFVSVAASGASIDEGIISPQHGAPAQVDQLRDLVGDRRIDVLLIQAGGNDIGFVRVVRSLVEADRMLDPVCYDRLLDNTFAAVADGDWSRGVSLGYDAPFSIVCRPAVSTKGLSRLPGLLGLPAAFARLDDHLASLDVGRVVLVGYPDPTGSAAGEETCGEIVGDTTPPFHFNEINRHEQELGVALVLEPLNKALRAAAGVRGWDYVDGVAEAFAAGHGYCAPWPDYEPPGGTGDDSLDHPGGWYHNAGAGDLPTLAGEASVTWYRTAAQSTALQGESPAHTDGTLHPNELGHDAIARLVLTRLGD